MGALEKNERETTYQLSSPTRENPSPTFICWTDDPKVAAHWRSLRWPVEVFGTAKGGPRSWEVRGLPPDRVVLLKLTKKAQRT